MQAYDSEQYPPNIAGAPSHVFRRASGRNLRIWLRYPAGAASGGGLGAVIFFFGGGFQVGTPQQFDYQAKVLAENGIVGVLADYRVGQRDAVNALDCITDAFAAMAYVAANSERLGIDRKRIAAAGGSAGGLLAAACATIAAGKANRQLIIPAALVLYNPLLVTADLPGRYAIGPDRAELFERLAGANGRDISPAHHLGTRLPPTLIMHGRDDNLVPFAGSEAFCQMAVELGADCRLIGFAGADHGFFNAGSSPDNVHLRQTTDHLVSFLLRLGWVDGKEIPGPAQLN